MYYTKNILLRQRNQNQNQNDEVINLPDYLIVRVNDDNNNGENRHENEFKRLAYYYKSFMFDQRSKYEFVGAICTNASDTTLLQKK